RARLNGAKNIVGSAAGRRDKRLGTGTEYGRQRVGATSGVRAQPSIVEDCELARGIAVEPVGNAVGVLPVVEADRRVGSIAPWLRLGPAAAAQGCNRWCRCRLTKEVRHGRAAGQQVRTVFAHAHATSGTARNVAGELGEPGGPLPGVVLPDRHEVV